MQLVTIFVHLRVPRMHEGEPKPLELIDVAVILPFLLKFIYLVFSLRHGVMVHVKDLLLPLLIDHHNLVHVLVALSGDSLLVYECEY